MKTAHKIVFADCRNMAEVLNESVHLIITSPPYWQLKDYGVKGQIGFDDSYEDYINNLNLVWKECNRVLHKGCRLCINIGDQFARSVYYGRYKIIPIRTEIIRFCETIGFDYMGAVIWQKVTTCNTTGGATIMGSFPYPRNGILKIDYEFILIFKKLGPAPKVNPDLREKSRLTTEEWNEYFSGHWNFAGERQNGHLAMFPEELPRRLIKMFSFVGDTILDPFLGSGTTILAAMRLQRHSIGYEINNDFENIILSKLGMSDGDFFMNHSVDISRPPRTQTDYTKAISQLPYIFRDNVKFDKKIDIKKITFGSKIDSSQPHKSEYFTVDEILSVDKFRLNTGLVVKLLGIKSMPAYEKQGIDYLVNAVKGRPVYLKFDNQKYDQQGNLLCYMYLKNKTFVNARLVKNGFACLNHELPITNLSLQRLEKKANAQRVDSQFSG